LWGKGIPLIFGLTFVILVRVYMRAYGFVALALVATLASSSSLLAVKSSSVVRETSPAKPAPIAIQRHWECVPIARALSGISIFGNAHTWWKQAEGRFQRGSQPRRGAVLAFKPHGSMRLGHVAAVSKLIDDRTVLVTHSNWSLINGRRGQIERNVKVIDVSPQNDWSRVRVWFAPLQDLGGTAWPVHGFIYPATAAPMSLPGNARVAGTMPASKAGIVTPKAKSAPLAAKPDKAALKAINKAQKKLEKQRERDEEREAAALKKTSKAERAKKIEPAPTGRLDYMGKMFAKKR
jgi:surface antigen